MKIEDTGMIMRSVLSLIFLLFLLQGCNHFQQDKEIYSIYFEDWNNIYFNSPEITEDGHVKALSKAEAIKIINKYRMTYRPDGQVFLGKFCTVPVDDIQEWLAAMGFTDIVFFKASSFRTPSIVREYHNGKIIIPSGEGVHRVQQSGTDLKK